jgi:hypothetical protein
MIDDVRFYANCGPAVGPIKAGAWPGSIGVLESPENRMPIGEASGFTRDEQGREVYRLVVHKTAVPGRFVVVDRRFVKVEG